MSILKKLFGRKVKETQKDTPKETGTPLVCPVCHSEKVTMKFSEKNNKTGVVSQSKQYGKCLYMDSGSVKKICSDCGHLLEEQDIDTPIRFHMKPQSYVSKTDPSQKESEKDCRCDEPLCAKCLVVNCKDDNCSTHTMDLKMKRRNK